MSFSAAMRVRLFLMLAVVLPVGCASAPKQVSAVTVRDAKFEVVTVLNADEIKTFERLWQGKVVVEAPFPQSGGRHFKLDISRGDSGNRWLYLSTGHVTLLTMTPTRVYKIGEVRAFNRLIGASP